MARFTVRIRGYVLGLLREPSNSQPRRTKQPRKRKISTEEISGPIPLAPEANPFPKSNPLPRSLSVQNLAAPNPSGHRRNLSAEIEAPRTIVIDIDDHVKPQAVLDSWETATLCDRTRHEEKDNLSPLSPAGNKRFTYGPVSPGAQPFDPLQGNKRLSMAVDARRISHYGAVSRLEAPKPAEDRMSKRMSKRMTWSLETYNTHTAVYSPMA